MTALPCTENPEAWYATEAGAQGEAMRICRHCPIAHTCALDAMREETGQPLPYRHGVRGAMTPAMRYHLARKVGNQ